MAENPRKPSTDDEILARLPPSERESFLKAQALQNRQISGGTADPRIAPSGTPAADRMRRGAGAVNLRNAVPIRPPAAAPPAQEAPRIAEPPMEAEAPRGPSDLDVYEQAARDEAFINRGSRRRKIVDRRKLAQAAELGAEAEDQRSQQIDAMEAQGDLAGQAAERRGDIQDEYSTALDDAVEESFRVQEDFQGKKALLAEKREALDNSRRKTIDPDEFWDKQSMGAKVALVLGNILGAAGQAIGVAGGNANAQNLAAGSIEGAIDKEIMKQRSELEDGLRGLQAIDARESDLYRQYQEELAFVDTSLKDTAYKKAIAEAEALRDMTKNEDRRMAIDGTIAELKAGRAAAEAEAVRKGAVRVVGGVSKETKKQRAQLLKDRRKYAEKERADLRKQAAKGEARGDGELLAVGLGGERIYANPEMNLGAPEKKELRSLISGTKAIKREVSEMDALTKNLSAAGRLDLGDLNSQERAIIESIYSKLKITIGNAAIKGVLSDNDTKDVGKWLGGSPADMLKNVTRDGMSIMRRVATGLESEVQERIETLGASQAATEGGRPAQPADSRPKSARPIGSAR